MAGTLVLAEDTFADDTLGEKVLADAAFVEQDDDLVKAVPDDDDNVFVVGVLKDNPHIGLESHDKMCWVVQTVPLPLK